MASGMVNVWRLWLVGPWRLEYVAGGAWFPIYTLRIYHTLKETENGI